MVGNKSVATPSRIAAKRSVFTAGGQRDEVLVVWCGMLEEEASWEVEVTMKKAFPELDLEVKVVLEEDGNDTDDALWVEDRIAQELAEEEQDFAGDPGETTTVDRELGRRTRTRPCGLADYEVEWAGR